MRRRSKTKQQPPKYELYEQKTQKTPVELHGVTTMSELPSGREVQELLGDHPGGGCGLHDEWAS